MPEFLGKIFYCKSFENFRIFFRNRAKNALSSPYNQIFEKSHRIQKNLVEIFRPMAKLEKKNANFRGQKKELAKGKKKKFISKGPKKNLPFFFGHRSRGSC